MGIALPGKTVCVAGAGGVGRTFAIECALSGAAVTLATRPTGEQSAQRIIADAKALMPQVKIEHALLNGLNRPFDLLINATPCGMYPKTQVSPIGQELLQGCRAVFDCIYNPTKTKLLLDSERLNIPSAGGMDMLVWQAVKAHEIWYGGTFHTADISQLIRDMSAQVDQDFPATLA